MKALLTINKQLFDTHIVVRLSKKDLERYDVAVFIPDYINIDYANFDVQIEDVVVPYIELN